MSQVNAIRNPDGIWINTQCFREEGINFQKNKYYTPEAWGSPAWVDYWKEQLRRCKEGYSIGGAYITGHHYFYLNFTQIMLTKDKSNEHVIATGKKAKASKQAVCPDFWDGDYNYFHALDIASEGCSNEYLKGLNLDIKILPKYLSGGYHMIVGKARRKGYQQPYSETIITPNGKTTMGNIKVGDYVNTPNGKAKVLEKYEQGECDVYEITLQDGRKVRCGKEHLWNIIEFRGSRKTVDTEFFLNKKLKRGTKGKEYYSYYLPQTDEVKFDKKEDIPINPYLLGLLIGDGSVNRSTCLFSTVDKELLMSIKDIIGDDYSITKTNNTGFQYRISYLKESNKNPILSELKNLNLRTTALHKFIPDIYKYSSIEDRYELVRGLMDTDGSITKDGSCNFVNTSEQLIDDLAFVLRSLGIRCKKSKLNNLDKGFSKNQAWQLIITTDKQIFKLKRKADLIRKRNYNLNKIAIVNVKKLDYKEQSACILIDSNDHLYLTTDFVVTHNSYKNAAICANIYNAIPDSLTIIGAFDKKFLYPRGTMGMTSRYLDFLNDNTGWRKAREYVDKQEHKRASFRSFKNGVQIEKGYQSEVMAITFKDNPDAARGKDAKLILFEEAGKFPNLKDSYMATKESLEDGAFVTGQMVIFGCVCAGTKVYTNEGKQVNIEDITTETGIIGYAANAVCKEPVTYLAKPAKKECFRITCSNDNIIECSNDHPLLYSNRHKYDSNGNKLVAFKRAENIKVGDQLILSRQVPIFGNNFLKYPRLIGLLIGDGYYGDGSTPQLAIADKGIKEFLNSENIDYSIYKEVDNYYYVGIKGFAKNLKEIGLYGQTKVNKRLPNNYHKYNQYSLSELIGGYFDADGSINYNKKKNSYTIKLVSISEELLKEVQDVLYRFGINSKIFKRSNKASNLKSSINKKEYFIKPSDSYSLEIHSIEDIIEFKKHIKLTDSKKQKILETVDTNRKGRNIYDSCIFKEEIKGKGWFFNNKELKYLKSVYVKKVEYIGEQTVYNLTADTTHTYITNKFISANTGGDMEDGTIDFADMFYNPEEYDLLPFVNIWDENADQTNCGFFHPENMNLVGFYDEVGNSKKEEAKQYEIDKRNAIRRVANSSFVLQKRVQEKPLCPQEAFLTASMNDFPIVELQHQLDRVKRENLHVKKGIPCLLYRDDTGKIRVEVDLDKKLIPLHNYKIKEEDIRGCVIIYEYPTNNAPKGLYKIGHDPYRQNQAFTSTSLGATYVYKGFLQGSVTSDQIVASYIGRPNTSDDYNRTLEMLAELYNTEIGYENEVTEVKSYFEKKRKLHLLAAQPDSVISANIKSSKVSRVYGIHMHEKLKDAGEKYIKKWLLTEKNIDENGEKILNLNTIYDIGLLEELIQYNRKGNFDRVMAFMILMMFIEEDGEKKILQQNNENNREFWDNFAKSLFTN